MVHVEIRRLAGLAVALGGSCAVEISGGYPATINDPSPREIALPIFLVVRIVRAVARGMLGDERVREIAPTMGAEDFSLLAREAPGCFFRTGVTSQADEPSHGHSPTFRIDERALPTGAALLAGCALRYLAQCDMAQSVEAAS